MAEKKTAAPTAEKKTKASPAKAAAPKKTASSPKAKTPAEKAEKTVIPEKEKAAPAAESKPAPRKTKAKKEAPVVEEAVVEETPKAESAPAGFDYENASVILSVRHLKQYFKLGGTGAFKYNKAVHDVSFDVYRGEVFGLVGESGCGKTTTGRSIIRLYSPTSGDVYFKGVRIGAGTRWNEKEIKYTRLRLEEKLTRLKEQEKSELSGDTILADREDDAAVAEEIKRKYATLRQEAIDEANAIIDEQKKLIEQARYDAKNCDRDFARAAVAEVDAKYKDFLDRTQGGKNLSGEEDNATFRQYKEERRVAKHARITSGMQMIFQDPMASINPRMTVRGIIAEGLRINGIRDRAFIDKSVKEMLELVGLLPEHADRYPHEFSGGQRQRIGIARALIMKPEVIIADEPISALDVSIQAQIINLLNELRDKFGLTILFIAHNLSVVKYFCDRIAVMYFGNLVELATSDELFKRPLHPYTRSLLSAVPHCDPDTEKSRTRIKYDPRTAHDYSSDKPRLVEITPGHFVHCNEKEEKQYRELLAKGYDSGYGR